MEVVCQLMLVPILQTVHIFFITFTILTLLQVGVGGGGDSLVKCPTDKVLVKNE